MLQILKLLWFLSLVCYQSYSYAEGKKITLVTAEWEPYISETKPGHGKFSEIVTAVFKEMGIQTEFVFAPWKRAETIVKNGGAFAAIPYSYTEERHKNFDYSVPIMNSPNVFFYKKKAYPNGISYTRLEDLARYRISGVTGYWYEDLFKQAKLPVEYVTTDEQSITKLYFNRVDLVACDSLVGWSLIKKLYPREFSEFAELAKPFSITQLHLLVSRTYPNSVALTQQFNVTFKRLRDKNVLPL
jgi:polar amino acid transport system substrate-binding protein